MKDPDRLNMNKVEKNDRTALHLAAISGSVDALRVMLRITDEAPKTFTQKKDDRLRQSRMVNVSATEVYEGNELC